MKNYESPVVLGNEELAEGVFAAASGPLVDGAAADGDCYTADAYIHQTPEVGRPNFTIRVNAHHDADHNSNKQELHISFNQAVQYQSCNMQGATLKSGDGTTSLVIELTYWNNHTDNIGGGDLVVTSNDGLAITSVAMYDVGKC